MNYNEMCQTLLRIGRSDVMDQLEVFTSRSALEHRQVRANLQTLIAQHVTDLLYGNTKNSTSWRVIAPLNSAAVLESLGHQIAVAWAVATEIRAGQIAAANARMIAAGCLICPSCGADGSAGDSSTPAFYYVETMDSRRSCGVKLHSSRKDKYVNVCDDYQDDYEGGRDERVCCEACGWEFELPEGVSFEHGVSGGVIDREVDAHLGVTTKRGA